MLTEVRPHSAVAVSSLPMVFWVPTTPVPLICQPFCWNSGVNSLKPTWAGPALAITLRSAKPRLGWTRIHADRLQQLRLQQLADRRRLEPGSPW